MGEAHTISVSDLLHSICVGCSVSFCRRSIDRSVLVRALPITLIMTQDCPALAGASLAAVSPIPAHPSLGPEAPAR